MSESANAAAARTFIEAFNERDLDRFIGVLDREIEIHGMRGTRRGLAEAREWATRAPGGVQQRIVLEELRETGDRVLALILREWWWDEGDVANADLAGTDSMAWLFTVRDGRIRDWRPFEDRLEAERALDVEAPPQ